MLKNPSSTASLAGCRGDRAHNRLPTCGGATTSPSANQEQFVLNSSPSIRESSPTDIGGTPSLSSCNEIRTCLWRTSHLRQDLLLLLMLPYVQCYEVSLGLFFTYKGRFCLSGWLAGNKPSTPMLCTVKNCNAETKPRDLGCPAMKIQGGFLESNCIFRCHKRLHTSTASLKLCFPILS